MLSQKRLEDYLLAISAAGSERDLVAAIGRMDPWKQQATAGQWDELQEAIRKKRLQIAGLVVSPVQQPVLFQEGERESC